MRAGRSVVDALASLADRLGLDEASSFVTVAPRHSLELGGDIATSLQGFSDDMRMKRLILAEKRANELAVRIEASLGVRYFPGNLDDRSAPCYS